MVATAAIMPAPAATATNTLPPKAKKCSCIAIKEKNNNNVNSFNTNNNNCYITKNTLNSNYAKYQQQRLQLQQPLKQQHSKRLHDCSPPQLTVHTMQLTKIISSIIFCICLILPLEINTSVYAAAVYASRLKYACHCFWQGMHNISEIPKLT